MGANPPDLETVFSVIRTLYTQNDSIPMSDKQQASTWLGELQNSVFAWKVADDLLHQKADLHSCYFGAHTLRTKIQNSFQELPVEAHSSLRDSLLQHISAITGETDAIIVIQLCLAVAHMILQASSWADPIGHLLTFFGTDPIHWWPLLEILTLLPEEVHSRKLTLGENRRMQVVTHLENVSPIVLNFLKQCLSFCVSSTVKENLLPVDLCTLGIVKCFGSWIVINPECFCSDRQNDVLGYTIMQLREGKCNWKMHSAATDCICALIEVVPDLDSSNNNNAVEHQSFQFGLIQSIIQFENAYSESVTLEDQEKQMNYCRIFSEYGESMIPYMLKSWRDPHYSIQIIRLIVLCSSHHDYEIAEHTFGFWYRISEALYHMHDEGFNTLFRSYAVSLVQCLYKHCQIEPDFVTHYILKIAKLKLINGKLVPRFRGTMVKPLRTKRTSLAKHIYVDEKGPSLNSQAEGPLTSSEEFYEFRRKASELLQDMLFITNAMQTFAELGSLLMQQGAPWEAQEAAIYLLHACAKSIDPTNVPVVQPIISRVLSFEPNWPHICLKLAAIKFLGGMSLWLNRNPEHIEKTMEFLVSCLSNFETSNAAAAALHNVCQSCANHIAERHIGSLLSLLEQMDQHNASNDAVIGLLKCVGHVMGILPFDQISQIIKKICIAQCGPFDEIIMEKDEPYERGSKRDPIYWLDRLSALFRNTMVAEVQPDRHPCQGAICDIVWPVISKACRKYQADVRIMERICRCIRFAIRCVGKYSHPFLEPLVIQLVEMYENHHHSCFLYLGSILVDEYGKEETCIMGLLRMLEAFYPPTLKIFTEPQGLRNHPDTVDDFFRLSTRYIQRCPVPLLRAPIITGLLDVSMQASQLDHRDANVSVMKFLFDLVHAGRRQKELEDFEARRTLVRELLLQRAPALVSNILNCMIFILPTYTYFDICDFLCELKEVMPQEFPLWLEAGLKQLPEKNSIGNSWATIEQLHTFHKQAINARNAKELTRTVKDFCRLYR